MYRQLGLLSRISSWSDPIRQVLFGLPVDALTMDQTVNTCERLISEGGSYQHVVLNAAKVVAAQNDPRLASIIRGCALVNADGQSIVWASRLLRQPLPERVAGIDLMDRLWRSASVNGFRVFLLGAAPEVVAEVANIARARGINVVGYHHGFWDAHSESSVVASVAETSPDLLFLALPSPQKEEFLACHLQALNARLAVGVGGSFDVLTGRTRRAPKWLQRIGLEWFFRLAQEPRRMFKRYLVGNSRFVALVATTAFSEFRGRIRSNIHPSR